jgi:hypothetical protein
MAKDGGAGKLWPRSELADCCTSFAQTSSAGRWTSALAREPECAAEKYCDDPAPFAVTTCDRPTCSKAKPDAISPICVAVFGSET